MRKIRPLITALLLFSLSSVALPQSFTGVLSGSVYDQQGSVIPHAMLTLSSTDSGISRSVIADDKGSYRFITIPPGKYKLTAETKKEGFKKTEMKIDISVASDVQADITLELATISGEVTIKDSGGSAENITVKVCCGGELSRVVTREQIVGLPTITRDVFELVSLSAGAVPTSENGGIGLAVNGQRSRSGNYVLDGGENNDIFFAGPAQTLPADSIKEFRVITNNYTAEYGRSAGFIANAVSSMGTNELHGSVYNFNRNSVFSANSFGRNANELDKPVFNRNQFGGAIGGPIKKDKLLFFGTVEPIVVRSQAESIFFVPTNDLINISSAGTKAIFNTSRTRLPQDRSSTNVVVLPICPAGAICDPETGEGFRFIPAFAAVSRLGPQNVGAGDPQDTILGSGRIDWNINQKMQLFGRYAISDNELFPQLTQPYSSDFNIGLNARSQNVLLNLTRVWSDRIVSESRITYLRPVQELPATATVGTESYFPDLFGPGSLPFGSSGFFSAQNLYQFYQTVSWARGDHLYKFGGQYINTRNNLTPPASLLGQLPVAVFPNTQFFVNGILSRYSISIDPKGRGPGENVEPPFTSGSLMRHYRYNEFSLFVQDSWKVTNRLTLSPGLRWEYFGVLHSTGHEKELDSNFYYGEGSNIFERIHNGRFYRTSEAPGEYKGRFYLPDYKNFAPRFGLAYDMFGDGSTVLRSGIGIFYDRNFGNAVSNVAINPPGYARQDFFGAFPFTPAFLNDPFAPIGDNSISLTFVPARHLDQNLKTAYSVSWNMGVERKLNKDILMSLTYVGASGVRLYSLNNTNRVNSGQFIGIEPDDSNFPNTLVENVFELNTRSNQGHSSYHSLQVRADSGYIQKLGLQFGANYTWSHSIDNASSVFYDDFVANPVGFGFLDAFNPSLDRGDSDFDTRQRFVANFLWDVPFGEKSNNWFVKNMLGGWGISGLLSFQTGQPFSIFDSGNPDYFLNESPRPKFASSTSTGSLIPDASRPNSFLFVLLNPVRDGNGKCLSTGPFFCSAAGADSYEGTISRNIFRRPGTQFHNLAVSKNIALPKIFGREGTRLQLRAEFYNVFNHANLYVNAGSNDVNDAFSFNRGGGTQTIPSVTVSRGSNVVGSRTFGLPSFIDNRQIVIAAKFIF